MTESEYKEKDCKVCGSKEIDFLLEMNDQCLNCDLSALDKEGKRLNKWKL